MKKVSFYLAGICVVIALFLYLTTTITKSYLYCVDTKYIVDKSGTVEIRNDTIRKLLSYFKSNIWITRRPLTNDDVPDINSTVYNYLVEETRKQGFGDYAMMSGTWNRGDYYFQIRYNTPDGKTMFRDLAFDKTGKIIPGLTKQFVK